MVTDTEDRPTLEEINRRLRFAARLMVARLRSQARPRQRSRPGIVQDLLNARHLDDEEQRLARLDLALWAARWLGPEATPEALDRILGVRVEGPVVDPRLRGERTKGRTRNRPTEILAAIEDLQRYHGKTRAEACDYASAQLDRGYDEAGATSDELIALGAVRFSRGLMRQSQRYVKSRATEAPSG